MLVPFKLLIVLERLDSIKSIEAKTCRLFNLRLKLMLTVAVFPLSGYFIFDGGKSLEK